MGVKIKSGQSDADDEKGKRRGGGEARGRRRHNYRTKSTSNRVCCPRASAVLRPMTHFPAFSTRWFAYGLSRNWSPSGSEMWLARLGCDLSLSEYCKFLSKPEGSCNVLPVCQMEVSFMGENTVDIDRPWRQFHTKSEVSGAVWKFLTELWIFWSLVFYVTASQVCFKGTIPLSRCGVVMVFMNKLYILS